RPAQIARVRPRADEGQVKAVARYPCREAAIFDSVFFRREIAAAAPRFVAHAPIAHIPGVALTGGAARCGQCRRARRRVAVIDPLVKIPRRQAAHVGRQIGSGPAQLAEAQEFIGPEMIRVILPRAVRRSFRPSRVYPEVRAARAILARPDAVAPVVAVGETPARPPDDARLDSLHRFDDRLPDAADVGDLRVLAHPDAVIDHAAQMLDEMSVYF